MSQQAVYVQALDGLLYKDPIISGNNWFVCFDDTEPPEIVMKRYGSTTEKSARRMAHTLLLGAGIGFELGEINSLKNGRSFPPTWKPAPASSIFFKLLAPIPVPRDHGGVKIKPSLIAGAIIFWHDFDIETVLDTISGKHVDRLLMEALIPFSAGLDMAALRKEACRQHPILSNPGQALPKSLRFRWSSSNATADSGQ